ncbi:uncharacterized protein LOC142975507 [Anticarsia gemmatalis]|uniref:uncharacterized protein LOC142975507 n=1 Tax=Anticarsia gemmatalis TaxID=129554 RepID=UPI003F75B1D8
MMISLVAKIINIFATTLQNVLLLASFTGKLIVSTLAWISSVIFSTLQSFVLFFQIVYEDNVTLFTEEIPASTNGILDAIQSQLTHIQSGVSAVYQNMHYKLSSGIASIYWMSRTVLMICGEVLNSFMNAVILIGDAMWLVVTFIPVHLPQLLRAVFKHIGNVIVNSVIDAYMTLLKFTNYLTEVPLQSFMGITSAIVIVRLCVHFRETILTHITIFYWSLVRNILYLYYAIFNYFTNSEVAVIAQIASGEDVTTRDVNFSSAEDSLNAAADSLCVICQERQKCVLTLPCRHVCLCTDCCRRLYGYQRTCPICRTFIYHSVTVYL